MKQLTSCSFHQHVSCQYLIAIRYTLIIDEHSGYYSTTSTQALIICYLLFRGLNYFLVSSHKISLITFLLLI